MPKVVTIGIKVDVEFVKLLNMHVELSGLRQKDQLDVLQQLGLIALMEMRGATEEQIHAAILPMWRDNITIAPSVRKVDEEGEI